MVENYAALIHHLVPKVGFHIPTFHKSLHKLSHGYLIIIMMKTYKAQESVKKPLTALKKEE